MHAPPFLRNKALIPKEKTPPHFSSFYVHTTAIATSLAAGCSGTLLSHYQHLHLSHLNELTLRTFAARYDDGVFRSKR